MKNAGEARSYGLYRHLRISKEIIENLLNYSKNNKNDSAVMSIFVCKLPSGISRIKRPASSPVPLQ